MSAVRRPSDIKKTTTFSIKDLRKHFRMYVPIAWHDKGKHFPGTDNTHQEVLNDKLTNKSAEIQRSRN